MITPSAVIRAAHAILTKPQGNLRGLTPASLHPPPPSEGRVTVRPATVARYRRVCQLPEAADPLCFAETLFLGSMARLVTHKGFPLSPLGLIHVRQTVRRHRPLALRRPLDLRCHMADVRETERGIEVDISMAVAQAGQPCWEGCATLLSRSAATRGRKRQPGQRHPPRLLTGDTETFDVPGMTGLAYAWASGDFNPHHLTRLMARPLGYRRPIAHGMWTLARAIGLLEQRHPLPVEVALEAQFKRPLFMPGKASFAADGPGSFGVFAPSTGAPHLLARVISP